MLSLLVSFVLGGQRYFYCAQMQEESFDACCAQRSGAAAGETPTVDREACCRTGHLASLSPSTTAHEDETPRAPLLAILPVARPSTPPSFLPFLERPPLARAGPGASDARERRLRLMVFLT